MVNYRKKERGKDNERVEIVAHILCRVVKGGPFEENFGEKLKLKESVTIFIYPIIA